MLNIFQYFLIFYRQKALTVSHSSVSQTVGLTSVVRLRSQGRIRLSSAVLGQFGMMKKLQTSQPSLVSVSCKIKKSSCASCDPTSIHSLRSNKRRETDTKWTEWRRSSRRDAARNCDFMFLLHQSAVKATVRYQMSNISNSNNLWFGHIVKSSLPSLN